MHTFSSAWIQNHFVCIQNHFISVRFVSHTEYASFLFSYVLISVSLAVRIRIQSEWVYAQRLCIQKLRISKLYALFFCSVHSFLWIVVHGDSTNLSSLSMNEEWFRFYFTFFPFSVVLFCGRNEIVCLCFVNVNF